MSPSLNDPSTALQAIDRLHELLSPLLDRRTPSPLVLLTEAGTRVLLSTPDWETCARLASAEIGLACRMLPRVRRHLLAMTTSLPRHAATFREPALRRAQAELETDPTAEAAS